MPQWWGKYPLEEQHQDLVVMNNMLVYICYGGISTLSLMLKGDMQRFFTKLMKK